MSEKKKEEYKSFIAVFSGSWEDLSKLDFSILGLKFSNIKSDEFKTVLKDIEFRELSLQNIINRYLEENGDSDRMFALYPLDFQNSTPEYNFWLVRDILLVIFPSDITLHYLMNIDKLDDGKVYSPIQTHNEFKPSYLGEPYDNYLIFYDHEIEDINKFIKLYNDRIQKLKYLKPTIHSYLSSFYQEFIEMQFLNLCIALETTVAARSELLYRIRRNTAIIVAKDIEHSRNIYSNIEKIYSLRSKIVHDGKIEYKKIYDYLPYLKCLVSRLIIELVTHDIKNLQDLNTHLTELGFGQKDHLSDNYIEIKPNTSVRTTTLVTKLE